MNKYIEYVISKGILFSRGVKQNKQNNKENGILVICRHPLGDSTLETPFIRELRKNYPDKKITLVCSPQNYNLWATCPYVDECLVYDSSTRKHYFLANLKRVQGFINTHQLKNKIELAIIPTAYMSDIVSAWLCYFTNATRRVTYSEKYDDEIHSKYMGLYDKYFTDVLDMIPEEHEVKKNLDIIRYLGLKVTTDNLELWTTVEDKQVVAGLFHKYKINSEKTKVVVTLSTSTETKDWPVERYANVFNALSEKYDFEILLVGAGTSAVEYGKYFTEHVLNVHDFTNKTTIRETIEIIRRSNVYVGGTQAHCILPLKPG